MTEYRKTPSSVVSLPGTSGGQPYYERNTALPIGEIIIGTGTPRLYDEIVSQWGVVRAEYEDLRSAAADLQVETERCGATADLPDGDESERERAFNDSLEDLLLRDRLHIEAGDGHDRGLGYLLAWGVESVAFGFSIAEPYWMEEGGIRSARVCVRPLERSAAYRWDVDRSGARVDPRPLGLYYLTAESGQQYIPYDELLHVTCPGSPPGHWYGLNPLLRPCVGPFKRWRLNQINAAGAELASRGRLVITEPESNDEENAQRIDALIDADADGRLTGFRVPFGTSAQMMFPSGSPPDFRSTEQGLTETIRSIFSNGAAALGLSTHGSRAVAAEMGAEDRKRAASRRNEIVRKIWHRMCAWVARQEGYSGRIRQLRTIDDAGEEGVSEWVDTIGRAVQAGVLRLGDADRSLIRSKLGLPDAEREPVQSGLSEVPDKYAHIDLSVTQGMRDAARNGIDRHEAGESGDGLKPETVRTAHEIAEGGDLTVNKWREMSAWFARHTHDGYGEPGSAQYAAVQLWGGKAGHDRADKIVNQLDAADREAKASDHPTHPRSCGCGACGVQLNEDAETFEIGGYVAVRPPLTVSIKGVDVQPETHMMWADEQEARAELDAQIAQDFAVIADEHRDATWETLERITPDEYRPDLEELQNVYEAAVADYEEAVDRYVERVRANTAEQVQAAAERQAESGQAPRADGDVDVERLRAQAAEKVEQARNAAMLAAEEAASRVQGEVERAWVSSGMQARRSFASRITESGLARSARTAGNAMETAATLETAADDEASPRGWRIVALTRTAILDGNACDHCEGEDGVTFVEDEDGDLTKQGSEGDSPEGLPWSQYPDLPDSGPGRCEGRERCRCRWVPVWGR